MKILAFFLLFVKQSRCFSRGEILGNEMSRRNYI